MVLTSPKVEGQGYIPKPNKKKPAGKIFARNRVTQNKEAIVF
jgi:hypothetical protein